MYNNVLTVPPSFVPGKFTSLTLGSLANEKNLINCSIAAARTYGGPITSEAVSSIFVLFRRELKEAEEVGLSPVFNVGISPMLIGQYSDVPGWHCDGVPFNQQYGQPDFRMVNNKAFNVSITLSSEMMGVASQEYVADPLRPRIWDEKHIFKDLHREINRILPRVLSPKDGEFVFYTPKTLVKAKACTRRGLQYHLRMSMYEKPDFQNKVGGVRTLYQLSEENGW